MDRFVGAGDRQVALAEFDILLGRFQHVGCDLLCLFDNLVGGIAQRRAADGHGTRAIRAAPVGDRVGIALHQADFLERHAEPGMDHLGIGRLMALAMAVSAGNDRHRAGFVEADFHPVVER